MFAKGSPWKRLIEKLAEKSDVRHSAGLPWSRGIPKLNMPKEMLPGSGCAPVILLVAGLTLALLVLIIF